MTCLEPREKWAHLPDEELRQKIDDYLTLGADQPHVPGRIAELQDDLDRRAEVNA